LIWRVFSVMMGSAAKGDCGFSPCYSPTRREVPDDAARTRPFFATLAARLVEARPRRRDGCARGAPRA